MGEDQEVGELTKEQIDSLRIETQSISPKEQEEVLETIEKGHHCLIKEFGEYIKNPITDKEAAERFIITDPETYEKFLNEWQQEYYLRTYDTQIRGTMRRYPKESGKFIIGSIPDFWPNVNPGNQKRLIEKFGGEQQAKKAVLEATTNYQALHELSHFYQDNENPYWLQESGAHWYPNEISSKNDLRKFEASELKPAENLYQKLVNNFKEDTHRIYFGQKPKKITKEDLIKSISGEEVKKVFPDYKVALNWKQIVNDMENL